MAKYKKTYVPHDLQELSALGTHSYGHRRNPVVSGKILKSAKGSREIIVDHVADRPQYGRVAKPKGKKSYMVNRTVVGSPKQRHDRVPKSLKGQLKEKRRVQKLREYLCNFAYGIAGYQEIPMCQPVSLEEAYSSAYLLEV